MTKCTRALGAAAVAVALFAGSARAATVIDFGIASAGPGATVAIGANVTGSSIFVDTVTILGAAMNGIFDVSDSAVCAGDSGFRGVLSFDRHLNTLSIVGSFPGLRIHGLSSSSTRGAAPALSRTVC